MKLTRRDVLVAGSAVVVGGCRAAPDFDDGLMPLAQWQEDTEMPENYSLPLVLYGRTVVNPGSDSAIPNTSLMNPHGEPMELLEVRTRIFPHAHQITQTGMAVGLKMDLNKILIVDGFVPINDFGNIRDSYEQSATEIAVLNFNNTLIGGYPCGYSWRLKYPLLIPAGQVLSASVFGFGQLQYPVTVDLAYICRPVPNMKPPTTVKVPWVASFESKGFIFEANTASDSETSGNLELFNPFNVPLELTRLSGHVALIPTTESSLSEEPFSVKLIHGTMRLRSSRGYDLVRTPTPIGGIFPNNWRVWDLPDKWEMSPREFYTARFNMSAIGAAGPEIFGRTGRIQFSIGMVGYRYVPYAALIGA